MSSEGVIEGVGVVEECLPSTKFRVIITMLNGEKVPEGSDSHEVLATISGRMRKNRVRILPGDVVRLEISIYDLSKGRIVFREKA